MIFLLGFACGLAFGIAGGAIWIMWRVFRYF